MPPTGTIGKWVECGGESWKSAHLWSIWSKTEVGAADWNATNFCIKSLKVKMVMFIMIWS
ncbi:hypothetical protein T05_4451 [Trichinella murrelli]|uniref:Uncharacterized protein n=1 Tax=Trichinella murrelli TaxID=144512 RepID=A0A0V0U362_9BILA|nr:hypothetical protein T05_4451 [Trichinella murrelli]